MPLWGPWYWHPFGPSVHLPPESFYNPLTYPYPADTGNLLPRWSGSFIQPSHYDPVAYELAAGGSLGQIEQHIADPTGGAYWDYDPMGPDPLGPGESIAVAWQWASQLQPRGFSAASSP